MDVKPEATIKEILTSARQNDKVVNVVLGNGKTYKGSIIMVGTHHVRIALKDQMSFYDVFIRLDHISAIEIPMRK